MRAGMYDLIQRLRQLAQASSDEYELHGDTYFSDDHLQDVLDRNRSDIYEEILEPIPQFVAGETIYRDYPFAGTNAETAASGSAVWVLRDSDGSDVGTANYTVDYMNHRIRFTANTDGGLRFLTYRNYNLNRAAAEVWRMKAANVAGRFDVRSDNHDLKRSQLVKQYLDMAKYYDNLVMQGVSDDGGAGGRMKTQRRVDLYE